MEKLQLLYIEISTQSFGWITETLDCHFRMNSTKEPDRFKLVKWYIVLGHPVQSAAVILIIVKNKVF